MPAKKISEEEINRILQSLDGITPAEAPAFFYTRLAARLDQAGNDKAYGQSIARPLLLVAGLCCLLILNISVIRILLREQTASRQTSQSTNGLQHFATAYDLTNTSLYTIENTTP
ncbi:MAG TPA: hypothetical protein VG842_08375 [Sediminibacterium sp.]|nr:hypothetical protein [Sediminibacterium sp.]